MRQILCIIKKEFARFFKDARLFFTTVFLPGIMIFAVYSLIGTITDAVMEEGDDYVPSAVVVNLPQSLSGVLGSSFELRSDLTVSEAMAAVKDGDLDLFIAFPDNFDGLVAQYDVSSGDPAPNVELFYNSAKTASLTAYTTVAALLDGYESSLSNKFDVNAGVNNYDLADSHSVATYILSMVVPLVLLMMLFSGSIAVVLEAVAGEKERGTVATLLVTPIKRSHLAIGKILALSVIAILSGISSFIGIVLALPRVLSGVEGITLSMFGALDYLTLLGVIIATVLVLVALLAIVSAYAKSVKEANALVLPVMIVVMICGLVPMFVQSASIGLFFIPVFNSALCIANVMSGTATAGMFAATFCMNVAFAALLSFVLTLMFKSEKIMFNKA